MASECFFAATILGGHLRGIPDWGPWDSSRLEWGDEEFVGLLLTKNTGDRKARTSKELEAIMREPLNVASDPARRTANLFEGRALTL